MTKIERVQKIAEKFPTIIRRDGGVFELFTPEDGETLAKLSIRTDGSEVYFELVDAYVQSIPFEHKQALREFMALTDSEMLPLVFEAQLLVDKHKNIVITDMFLGVLEDPGDYLAIALCAPITEVGSINYAAHFSIGVNHIGLSVAQDRLVKESEAYKSFKDFAFRCV